MILAYPCIVHKTRGALWLCIYIEVLHQTGERRPQFVWQALFVCKLSWSFFVWGWHSTSFRMPRNTRVYGMAREMYLLALAFLPWKMCSVVVGPGGMPLPSTSLRTV